PTLTRPNIPPPPTAPTPAAPRAPTLPTAVSSLWTAWINPWTAENRQLPFFFFFHHPKHTFPYPSALLGLTKKCQDSYKQSPARSSTTRAKGLPQILPLG
ncbi:hypothetical protein QQF64_016805, partial [Cirrhinus molitorella]